MTMCVSGFGNFMRYSQISNLSRSDMNFEEIYMKLFIEKSKIDLHREVN